MESIGAKNEKYDVGEHYRVIGTPGDYQVMERFGDYRLLKKVFKTLQPAIDRARQMQASKGAQV